MYSAVCGTGLDTIPLPGFEHDDWVPRAGCGERTLAEMVTVLRRVRAVTAAPVIN